ncbi:hypothetical protein [Porphyromonas sp.]
MSLRSLLLLSALLLAPLSGEAKIVKPKAPTTPPEQLLHEAERAYRAYQFDVAKTALEKYIAAHQRRTQSLPDSITMLQEQIARAERMYGAADELHVVDSTLVSIARLGELFPQGAGRFLASSQLPEELRGHIAPPTSQGDSLHPEAMPFPFVGFVDALRRNCIIPEGHALAWFAPAGRSWERQNIAVKTLEADEPLRAPFLLEDGMTLFFARRLPSGLGGYDLYMTRLTEQGNSFFESTLLGMPYNSPYNDYLLAYHESEGWGILVSDRFAPAGQVHLYRFTGRPAFLSAREGGQTAELSGAEAFRRASLSGVLYSAKSETSQPTTQRETKEELTFHLQGAVVYHRWADFKTEEGRRTFAEAQALREVLDREAARLEQLRAQWRTSEVATRSELRSEILHLEAIVHQKQQQYRDLLNAVRRHEGVR